MKFSVIIPHINDMPHLWFTVHSIIESMRRTYQGDSEIIVVDNGSKPEQLRLVKRLMEDRNIKGFGHKLITYPEQLHSKPAINMGAWQAKGEYLTFIDSHCIISSDFFNRTAGFFNAHPNVATLHSPISWFGYNPNEKAYQYQLQLEDKFWATFRNHKVADIPYPIAASGNTGMTTRKDFFMKIKGFPGSLRWYGGGEPYYDLITWMFGREVWLHPDLHCYHFACCPSRDYHRSTGKFFRNVCIGAYICGGMKYVKPLLEKHIREDGRYEENYRLKYEEALKLGRLRRKFVERHAKYTLDDVLQIFEDRNIYH